MRKSWGDQMVARFGYYDYIEHGRNRREYYWNKFGQWLADHTDVPFRIWRYVDEHFVAPLGVY